MKATFERLEAEHEALIAALDRNDAAGIERAARELHASLERLRGFRSWNAEPEFKLAAERIGRLADTATMRINVLNDHARRSAAALAELRGQAIPATYTR